MVDEDENGLYSLCIGILLVVMNLSLDGYTNNEQEHIFKSYSVTPFKMMRNVNLWQFVFLGLYLVFMHFVKHAEDTSEMQLAYHAFYNCPDVRHDVAVFCLCAAIGQLAIFIVMKEFGSLMWITISITRKLFTILVSVVMFNHVICLQQWLGVAAVFSGLILEVVMSYAKKSDKDKDLSGDKVMQAKKKD